MQTDKSFRRLPLRDLITDAEKRCRDLAEQLHVTWLGRANDLHELSRPVRRRSHYPTLLALLNAYQKLDEVHQEATRMLDYLEQELDEIREHARRERLNRKS
jgi:hypothetical protein